VDQIRNKKNIQFSRIIYREARGANLLEDYTENLILKVLK